MSGLINGLLEGYFNDIAPTTIKQKPTQPPVKQPAKESHPLVRPLTEVIKEREQLKADEIASDEPLKYDKARPLWSPFGPLPLIKDQAMPKAVYDPNLDEEQRIPLDVDARNAWLERG